MAKVLVVENDPVIAAVLEDRLRVAGHQVQILRESSALVLAADDEQADLVILEVPGAADIEAIRGLRWNAGTRTVAVMVLSDSNEPVDRIAALKAGADDYLARPFDLEELDLRCDRLLGTRIANLHMLQGDLSTHPLWALLQYLRQVHRSGNLRVRGTAGSGGSGTLELRAGELVSARWGNLRGDEALLALLCTEEGSFRLDENTEADAAGEDSEELPMNELLMRAAWLKDEIEKRRHFLPATGEPLIALAGSVPPSLEQLANLPLQRILARVHRLPGTRVFDLLADETEAPLTTRLAVAWLFEHNLLSSLRDRTLGGTSQNTMELSNAIVFEIAIDDLIAAAAAAGLPAAALPYLVLVEPAAWPELRELLEKTPGFSRNEALQKLVEQVDLRRAGSASFSGAHGKLSLHIQVLTAAAQPQIATIVPGCAGVLIWLNEAAALETTRNVVQRLEASRLAASGMLVSGSPAAHREAERLAQGSRRWRASGHAPQSLLGILRLLHPRESR